MTTSPTSARIASVIARKSSTSWLGVPSGRRAWMWIIEPPSSTIRRASAPYSAGVYGIAGHWSRLATAPEIAHVRMTGSSRLMASGTSHSSLCPIAARGATRWRSARLVRVHVAVGRGQQALAVAAVLGVAGDADRRLQAHLLAVEHERRGERAADAARGVVRGALARGEVGEHDD